MSVKPIYIVLFAAFFIFGAGMIYNASTAGEELAVATENVKVVKDSDDIWRIRDTNGNNKGSMRVKRNDQIFWQPQGSRVQFRFHKNVNAYFDYPEGMFEDGQSQIIDNNQMLRVTIKPDAPMGEVVYDVYVYADDTYVVGNSPPVFIVY